MRTIKFDDYLEKRLKEPEFKTNFENENAKLNLVLALLEDEDTVNSIDENDLEA
ncbi:XRE family transcriptional regulator [Enterococcus hirae]|nr:XRE family transcriptional regulator [Enterococcus hirae]